MMQHIRSAQRVGAMGLVGIAAVGIAACSDLMSPGSGPGTTVSFRTSTAGASLSTAPSASFALIPLTGNGHTVDIQKVDVMFDQVKLERVHTGDERDSDATEDDSDLRSEEEFKSGPVTVSLPLTGGIVSPFSQALPAGAYDELQMKASSVRLQGTYDGQAFDVLVPINAKFEMRLAPPLKITATTDRPDITVNVNVLSWFKNADGSVVDPRTLAANSTARAAFRTRVRASFKAFKDKNRDGTDSDSR